MERRTSFIKLIQFWGIIFPIGIGISIVAIDVISSYHYFNLHAEQMRTEYTNRQKQLIKQEVNRVVDLISYEKAQSEILTKERIKSMVYEAHSITQNIYQQNNTTKNDTEIQQMIKDALRPIRFEQESGYYFINRIDGLNILFANKPEMEGLSLLNVQDTQGQSVVKDMIQIAEQSGEGFYEYHWTKPDAEGKGFKKISFIKRFEPYDWFIGTGLYVVDFEDKIKADLLSTISRIRFGKEGYIFINRLNGDALISNGKLFSGTKKLWEGPNKNTEKIKNIFQKELSAALKPDGDYIYYSWEKLTDSKKESPKASFIYGIPDLQWLVGAGVYLDDVEMDIALMRTGFINQMKLKMLYSILIVMGISAIIIVFFNWLNRRLKNDFTLFFSFFNRAAYSHEKIDRENVKFVELDQMAENANKMLADRKQAEEALRESEEKLKAIFEANPAPVVVYDGIGHPLYLNPAFTEVFEWSLNELRGKLIPFVPEDQEELTKLQIKEIYKFGNPVRFETKRLSKHGGTINVLLSAAIIKNFQGINSGLVVNLTDITEQKKIEALLRQSQKMEAIGTLAGGIAHDFNNILSGIFGYTQMAGMNLNDPVKIKKNLDQVAKGAQRAAELAQQILTISRQVDYKKNLLELNFIVKEAVKFLHSSIPTTIEIIEKISSRAIVLADPTQVYQVVMNLCTNAYHSMSATGGTLTVELSDVDIPQQDPLSGDIQKSGKYVKLEVRDTGHGMNKETLEKIFDPYFTTKQPDKGTGLGLAVVEGVVKKHNGFVKAFSELGHGSKFQVFLPRIEKGNITVIPEKQPGMKTGTEKIMLVDDEENILDTTKNILEKYGYKITIFKEGQSALQAFSKDPNYFDLVITDMAMPNMAGDRLSAELIKIRPDIPILLCTGFSETISEEKALSLGIKGFLMKPILMKDLAQKIRKVLD
jgi:PAS domain S-box-containing protein